MNMAKIACFLAQLMGLRSLKTCNQGNKYMEMCRTILCINICNLFDHTGLSHCRSEIQSRLGLGTFKKNLRLYTTSPVVIC